MQDIHDTPGGEPDIRDVDVTLELALDPIPLRVRRFVPLEGDVTARRWLGSQGQLCEKQLTPFALDSIWATAHNFADYVEAHCLSSPPFALRTVLEPPHPIVGLTYGRLTAHLKSLVVSPASYP